MKIICLGAPGAGKGTQAEKVAIALGIPTVSTGAIIRAAVQNATAMGKKAKKFIDEGALVPDDVVIEIIKERLNESDCDKGYILDGFPRTVPQAQALDAMGIEIDCVISLEVADETIIKRMSGRRVCLKCGASYHTEYKKPAKEDVCDVCGDALSIRKDDAPEVVESRLKVYHEETEPLKDYYAEMGVLREVQGQEELADTTKLTLEALGIKD